MAHSSTTDDATSKVFEHIMTELIAAFSSDLTSFSKKLLAKKIISKESHDQIFCQARDEGSSRINSPAETGEKLVSSIADRVHKEPSILQSLIQLWEEELRYKDIATKLREKRGTVTVYQLCELCTPLACVR